jgi:glycosyltransferase involved in cell wall biosynthesis
MKILILTPEFLPVWGGVGTYFVNLAKNFPKEIELLIVTPQRVQFYGQKIGFDKEKQTNFDSNVSIINLGTAKDNFLFNLSFQLRCAKEIKKIVKENNINLIHSTSSMPDLFISSNYSKIPRVTTIHTTIEQQIRSITSTGEPFSKLESSEKMTFLLKKPLIMLENTYYRNNKKYITVSNWAKDQICKEKKINHKNVDVIPNGVDPNIFSPLKKFSKSNQFSDIRENDTLKVLYLSRFIASKGYYVYKQVISKILKRYDVHFIFAGPGLIEPLNLPKKNFTYLGYVPYEYTPELYSLSDIFILPSLSENCPMSILEAMASQIAVIASDVGGIPEIIDQDTGILIPPNNSNAIHDSLIKVIGNDNLRKNLGFNARERVVKNYTWEIAAKKTIKLYSDLIFE